MKCPFCSGTDSKVLDSRPNEDKSEIRRRRECNLCQRRFTTYERIEYISLYVIKKDNTREYYDRSKIEGGISRACYKRPVSAEEIKKAVDDIESEIFKKEVAEISSSEIGEIVMERIRLLDQVAYVRFASVYREFKDVNTFIEEIKKLNDWNV